MRRPQKLRIDVDRPAFRSVDHRFDPPDLCGVPPSSGIRSDGGEHRERQSAASRRRESAGVEVSSSAIMGYLRFIWICVRHRRRSPIVCRCTGARILRTWPSRAGSKVRRYHARFRSTEVTARGAEHGGVERTDSGRRTGRPAWRSSVPCSSQKRAASANTARSAASAGCQSATLAAGQQPAGEGRGVDHADVFRLAVGRPIPGRGCR